MVLRLLLFLLGTSSIAEVFSEECTVAHSETEDDSPAILKAFSDCQVDSVITFSQANYSAYTPVSLIGLSNYTAGISPVFLSLTDGVRERDRTPEWKFTSSSKYLQGAT